MLARRSSDGGAASSLPLSVLLPAEVPDKVIPRTKRPSQPKKVRESWGRGSEADVNRRHPWPESDVDRSQQIRDRIRVVCLSMTFQDIGKATGTNAETVRRYLRSSNTIPALFIAKLCEATGSSAQWVLSGIGTPYSGQMLMNATIAQLEIVMDDIRRARRAMVAARFVANAQDAGSVIVEPK